MPEAAQATADPDALFAAQMVLAHEQWRDALDVIAMLVALGPQARTRLGGVHVRGRSGPVRAHWLMLLKQALRRADHPDRSLSPWMCVSSSLPQDRLAGGMDIGASLDAGRAVVEDGVLARSHGGCLVLGSAQSTPRAHTGILASALDNGWVQVEADGVSAKRPASILLIALDEAADDDECLPLALKDRVGLSVQLDGVPWSVAQNADLSLLDNHQPQGVDWQDVAISNEVLEAIARLHAQVPQASLRSLQSLTLVTRVLAALGRETQASLDHVVHAFRLVIGVHLHPPQQAEEQVSEEEQADQQDAAQEDTPDEAWHGEHQPLPPEQDTASDQRDTNQEFDPDQVPESWQVDAEAAMKLALSEGSIMIERAQARAKSAGRSGSDAKGTPRGRPTGVSAKPPFSGARPHAISTLRAAAPWQTLRRRTGIPEKLSDADQRHRPIILPSDFRYIRRTQPRETVAIFAVDASGSTAMDRLGEAKGAIALLLGECYVKREQVALVAFRGLQSEILLEPTRALVRAKRNLTALPGGGPTPLAHGLFSAMQLALQARQRGATPLLVVLSDGSGNIALDGTFDRAQAQADAMSVARQCAAESLRCVMVDIARRPRERARELADAMQADLTRLPMLDAQGLAQVVTATMASQTATG